MSKGILGTDLAVREYAITANADLGIRDSGKTYTATKAAEELMDAKPSIPFIALDPIGVWHAMRIPGAGKGYPVVVAGGKYGDVPLTTANVGTIVRAAMEANVSLVLDLFSKDLSKADWKRIVREVCEILLHENESLRHIFIEEAGEFVPQRVRPGEGQVFDAVERVVRMGGNSKLGCTLINQRSADLNKSVLELCGNVLVHRQTGKNTLQDLGKWLKLLDPDQAERVSTSLPGLKSGQCWLMSTQLAKPVLVKVPRKNSKHPDRREESLAADAEKARDAMDKGDFLSILQRRLAPKAKPAAAKVPAKASVPVEKINMADQKTQERALAAAHAAGFQEGVAVTTEAARVALDGLVTEIGQVLAAAGQKTAMDAERAIKRAVDQVRKAGTARPVKGAKPLAAHASAPAVHHITLPRQSPVTPVEGLSNPQAALLKSLAWWRAMGHETVTRAQAAAIARWQPNGSNVKDRTTELKRLGLVEQPEPGTIALTAAGVAAAPEPDTAQTLVDSIRAILKGPQDKVFMALREVGDPPGGVARADLAASLGWEPNGSNIKDRMTELVRLEIAEYPRPGFCRLQDWAQA